MNKDKALEDLFLTHQPHFEDNDAFMASLTKRLDAVEFIKQHQEATIRRYKLAMIAVFFVEIISGAVTLAFVLSIPTDIPLFTFHVQSRILLWISENSRFFVSIALSLLMCLGLMSIVSNIHDILRMRVRMDYR